MEACIDQLLKTDIACTLPGLFSRQQVTIGEIPPQFLGLVPMLRKDCGLDFGAIKQPHNLAHAALLAG